MDSKMMGTGHSHRDQMASLDENTKVQHRPSIRSLVPRPEVDLGPCHPSRDKSHWPVPSRPSKVAPRHAQKFADTEVSKSIVGSSAPAWSRPEISFLHQNLQSRGPVRCVPVG
jgi:hypothetical protein